MGADPYKYFRIEARELVEHLNKDLLELEKACSPATIARLLRYAHTLKGAARVVKQLRIAEAAHQLEELITPLRDRTEPVPSVDPMLAEVDKIGPLLAALEQPAPQELRPTPIAAAVPETAPGRLATQERAGLASKLYPHRSDPTVPIVPSARAIAASAAAMLEQPAVAPRAPVEVQADPEPAPGMVAATSFELKAVPTAIETDRTVRADVAEIDVVVDAVNAALSELTALRGQIGKLEELRHLAELCTRQLAAPRRSELRRSAAAVEKARTLAEDLSVSTRNLDASMTATLERARRELEHARGQAEQLRLSPASAMFASLERAVRDAARELGRQVRVETRGGDTRLDGSVLEVVQSAFFHVARNSVAHGIEPVVERRAAGKPDHGTVYIEVARVGSRVAFRCKDDGAGLDVAAIRKALARAGKNVAASPDLGSSELLDLLLHAGVSTAPAVTAVSGRGVGLDVLREAAERLGAGVRLDSQPGRGFSVELIVPLTAAAVEALAVESGGTLTSLPLDAVRRSVRVRTSEVTQGATGLRLVHEGVALPFLPLALALHQKEPRDPPAFTTAVVIESSAGALAVGVTRVIGTKTVVLRRLPPLLPRNPLLLGAALNPLGDPELVLDPDGLYAQAARGVATATVAPAARLPVLIVDDSLTTRMLEQSILESAGYRVALACSAEEGLQKARESRYGLFLVDVEMPGMDGFSFVEATRRDPELQKIPAVLVSSRDAPEDLARGKAAGARGYMVKGRFDQRELLSLIRKLLATG
jgi:two-component system chemotaxis sensor kinase CheA